MVRRAAATAAPEGSSLLRYLRQSPHLGPYTARCELELAVALGFEIGHQDRGQDQEEGRRGPKFSVKAGDLLLLSRESMKKLGGNRELSAALTADRDRMRAAFPIFVESIVRRMAVARRARRIQEEAGRVLGKCLPPRSPRSS